MSFFSTVLSGKSKPCALPTDQSMREIMNRCVGTHFSKCTDDFFLFKYSRFLNRLAALQTGAVVLKREEWIKLFKPEDSKSCEPGDSMFSMGNMKDCFPDVKVVKPDTSHPLYKIFRLLQTYERNNFVFLYNSKAFQDLWCLNRRVGVHLARCRLKKLKESPITKESFVLIGDAKSPRGKQWKDCNDFDNIPWLDAVMHNEFLPEIARRAVAPNVAAYNQFVGRATQHLRDVYLNEIKNRNTHRDIFSETDQPAKKVKAGQFVITEILKLYDAQENIASLQVAYTQNNTHYKGSIEHQFQDLIKSTTTVSAKDLKFKAPIPFSMSGVYANLKELKSGGSIDFPMLLWAAQRHNMAMTEAKYKFDLLKSLLKQSMDTKTSNVADALIGKINLMHLIQDARTQVDVLNQFLPDVDPYTLCNRLELENVVGVYIESAENSCSSDKGVGNKKGSVTFPKIKTVLGLHDFVSSARSRKTNILTDTIFSKLNAPPSAASGAPGSIKIWDISPQARCKAFHAHTPVGCFDAYIESEQRKCEAYNMQYKGKFDDKKKQQQLIKCKGMTIGQNAIDAALNPLIPRYLSWVHLIPEGSVTWIIDTSLPGKIHVVHPFWETTDTVLKRKRGGKRKGKSGNPNLQELTTVPDLEHAMSHLYLPPSVCVTNPLMNFEDYCMQVFEANKLSCNMQFGKLCN
eukprot:jgi/Bigna1/129962/aug1.10_g4670